MGWPERAAGGGSRGLGRAGRPAAAAHGLSPRCRAAPLALPTPGGGHPPWRGGNDRGRSVGRCADDPRAAPRRPGLLGAAHRRARRRSAADPARTPERRAAGDGDSQGGDGWWDAPPRRCARRADSRRGWCGHRGRADRAISRIRRACTRGVLGAPGGPPVIGIVVAAIATALPCLGVYGAVLW